MLALHGWGRRGRDFAQSLRDIPSLAPDLPGFGSSPPPREAVGAEGYADMVMPLVEAFNGPPVLVGHSFGGRVATCLAAREPDSFRGLVLTGAPVVRLRSPSKPSAAYRLMRAMHRAGLVSKDRMEAMRQRLGSTDYRNASGVMRDILVKVVNESYEPQLSRIECPVALVWGASDREVPVAVGELALDLLRESRPGRSGEMTVIDGAGHNLPLEEPQVLREVVLGLLDDQQ